MSYTNSNASTSKYCKQLTYLNKKKPSNSGRKEFTNLTYNQTNDECGKKTKSHSTQSVNKIKNDMVVVTFYFE